MSTLKRWGDAIGYMNLTRAAIEALVRIPLRPEPPSRFAEHVWAHNLPGDLRGKTFAITGCSRGLGFVLAKRIAERSGNVVLLNRPSKHTDAARKEIQELAVVAGGQVTTIDCDLCDFSSVKSAAAELRAHIEASSSCLDCLVLNAGLMAQLDVRTKDGFDIQMQANHLSHFLLTSLVFDLLEQAAGKHGEARVVSHSSGARHSPDEALRAESFEQQWADDSPSAGDAVSMAKWVRYQQSKRANLAFTYALADWIDRKGSSGVKAVCAHPGATNSGLQSHTDAASWLDRFINGMAIIAGQSTEDGCLPLALASIGESTSNGDFFGPKGVTGNAELLKCERTWGTGYDEDQLSMLWTKSNAATGAKW